MFGPDGVVAAGAEGDERVGPVPDARTAFRVASCTKSFTAATLLTFAAEGALSLETPLTDVLDAEVLGASRAPTLGELASMAGGIPIDDPWADRQESMTAADFDRMVGEGIRLAYEPGTTYEYSSFAYAILGRVLERVGGRPYPELVRERIIEPLGLTGLGYDRWLDAPIAPGYARVEGEWVEQPWAEPGAFSALGGMIATPTALATWASWLASAWRDDAADDVLAAGLRRAMQEPRTPVPGPASTHYGLGLVVEEDPRHGRVVSHSGGYPGYGANMRWHAASGIGVVVLENARYSGATPARDAGAAPAARQRGRSRRRAGAVAGDRRRARRWSSVSSGPGTTRHSTRSPRTTSCSTSRSRSAARTRSASGTASGSPRMRRCRRSPPRRRGATPPRTSPGRSPARAARSGASCG